jgi:hypothetical protein
MVGFARRRLGNDLVRPLCYAPGGEYAMSDGRKAEHPDALICAVTWPDKGDGFVRVLDKGAFDSFDVLDGLYGDSAVRGPGDRWTPGGLEEFHLIETRIKLEAL